MKKLILLDGGFGRELERNNISIEAPLWSANAFYDSPETIKKIHKDFIKAGSSIITTNTYALTNYILTQAGKESDQERLLDQAYELAHEAREESGMDVQVAASLPPLGESYRHDLVKKDQLLDEYKLLVKHAKKNNADILLGETLTTIAEAEAVLEASKGSEIPVWISFSVEESGNLRSGESLKDAANRALDLGAKAILVNCSHSEDISRSMRMFEEMQEDREFLYGGYANRFTPVRKDFKLDEGLNTIDDQITIPSYCNYVDSWIEHGASIVGGCCGIGADFISEIHEHIVHPN
jgi:S-methylmethionine-dependent homocysteine/selenocysteine methylase